MKSPQQVILLDGFKLENVPVLIGHVTPPLQLINTLLEVATLGLSTNLRPLHFSL